MTELINLRLSRYAAQSFWRSSTATHFGGINGTMTFDKDSCQALADSGRCPQSPLNESWCVPIFPCKLRLTRAEEYLTGCLVSLQNTTKSRQSFFLPDRALGSVLNTLE